MEIFRLCLTCVPPLLLIAACKKEQAPGAVVPVQAADVCSNADGALTDAAFVFVASPHSGERVASGFTVRGCSRTFESTVNWKLKAGDGTDLAAGHAQGGGVDGPGAFSFAVNFTVPERQIGHLEVYEEDASDGEGAPRPRNLIPLVLKP